METLLKKKVDIPGLIVKIVIAWALIAFVIYPVINLLYRVFFGGGTVFCGGCSEGI